MEEKFEQLGRAIDDVENLSFALKMNIPAEMHVDQPRKYLPGIIEKLKQSFVELSGENPWE